MHLLAGPVIKLLSIDNVLSQVLTAVTNLLLYMDMYLFTLYCIEKRTLHLTVNLAIIIQYMYYIYVCTNLALSFVRLALLYSILKYLI